MDFTTAVVSLVGMVLLTYIVTLAMRPRSGARVGARLAGNSFFIETKEPDSHSQEGKTQ